MTCSTSAADASPFPSSTGSHNAGYLNQLWEWLRRRVTMRATGPRPTPSIIILTMLLGLNNIWAVRAAAAPPASWTAANRPLLVLDADSTALPCNQRWTTTMPSR